MIETNLFVAIVMRVIVLALTSLYLLRKWFGAEKRFFSDFPFLIGLTMAILAVAKLYDLWLFDFAGTHDLEMATISDPSILGLAKIRYLLIIGNVLPLFSIMLIIWFRDNKRVRYASVVGFIGFWTVYILIAPTFAYLKNALSYMLLPLCLLSVITYLFLYKNQRLPEIHSLVIGIAWIAYIFSTVVRPLLYDMGAPPWGLSWIAELIDVVIWGTMALGYIIKPHYYTK